MMLRRELTFLAALWKANLLKHMEYRAAFLSQILGMILNNGVYFLFWVIFFDRFKEVRGWALPDMMLLFGIVATGFGIGTYLFGNVLALSEVISEGRLDYFLSLPRPVLIHTLASNSVASGMGDFTYGILSYAFSGYLTPDGFARFFLGALTGTCVFLGILILAQSMAFWLGNANMLAAQVTNAIITFSIYPITLFDGTAKLLLFTVLPAAFIGAIPAEFVRSFTWTDLGMMAGAAVVFLGLGVYVFHRGLRRYESGSAMQIQS